MSITGNRERTDRTDRPLSTADLAAAAAARRVDDRADDDESISNERDLAARDERAEEAMDEAMRDDAARDDAVARADDDRDDVSRTGASRSDTARADMSRPGTASTDATRMARADAVGTDATRVDATRDTRADTPRGTRTSEALEPLFTPDLTDTYRQRWTAIQTGFVDDPRQAVRNGDELVAQIMTNLANSFAEERHRVEAQLDETGEGSTENLRIALRRYRSFFERLLSL